MHQVLNHCAVHTCRALPHSAYFITSCLRSIRLAEKKVISSDPQHLSCENSPRIGSNLGTDCFTMPAVGRIGRADLLWTITMLARPGTKWNEACDRRLARWICHINQSHETLQSIVFVGDRNQDSQLGFFHDASFAGDLQDSKVNFRVIVMRLWTTNICSDFSSC